jgi:glycosyltransferase involved in cell wall biosynthesis
VPADAEPQKLVTFAIPCYNSAAYMDNCVLSVMDAFGQATDYEIVIVDDGSTKDDTPAKADEWARRYPDVVRAVHQENGGHGAAVLAGLEAARGIYFKVIDSDDWIDAEAARALFDDCRRLLAQGEVVDLYIANYVYEHVEDDTRTAIGYRSVMPRDRVFTWDEMGSFRIYQNLLMHSLMYRTEVLRDGGVPLPRHTFYVDNIYAYVPLPRCKKLYYKDVDLYRYFIGREDQSVNEQVMVSRYDQQLRITRIMMEAYHLYDDVESEPLRSYMLGYFTLMMAVSSLFGHMSEAPTSDAEVDRLWSDLKAYDERMYNKARHHFVGIGTNLPGRAGRSLTASAYRAARRIFKFN